MAQLTTPTSTKYPSGNSVILAEVAPSLARYIRTRAKVSTIFIRDDDGYVIGTCGDDNEHSNILHTSVLVDAARRSRWAHGSGDNKDILYETVLALKVC